MSRKNKDAVSRQAIVEHHWRKNLMPFYIYRCSGNHTYYHTPHNSAILDAFKKYEEKEEQRRNGEQSSP